ncbi:hypothetical protein BKA80DRAFT_267747 [Phyllosticta citrichinensis]
MNAWGNRSMIVGLACGAPARLRASDRGTIVGLESLERRSTRPLRRLAPWPRVAGRLASRPSSSSSSPVLARLGSVLLLFAEAVALQQSTQYGCHSAVIFDRPSGTYARKRGRRLVDVLSWSDFGGECPDREIDGRSDESMVGFDSRSFGARW